MSHRNIGLFPPTLEFREAQLFNHEFHAGFIAVFPVAQRIEDFDDRFNAGDQFLDWSKLSQYLRNARCRTESTPCDHAEAVRTVRRFRGQQPDVMNRCQGAVLPAPRECDFEFAGQALIELQCYCGERRLSLDL